MVAMAGRMEAYTSASGLALSSDLQCATSSKTAATTVRPRTRRLSLVVISIARLLLSSSDAFDALLSQLEGLLRVWSPGHSSSRRNGWCNC